MDLNSKKIQLINPNLKVLFLPVLFLVILVILSVVLITNGSSRLIKRISEIDESKKGEAILNEKLSVLSGVQSEVLSSSDTVVLALPEENPGLLMITQLKQLAASGAVSLSKYNFNTERQSGSEVEATDINLRISGKDLRSTLSMLFSLENVLPVSTLEKAAVSIGEDGVGASLKLVVYWSALPTQLPALDEPVKQLTQKEEGILGELMGRQAPEFESFVPSGPTQRTSPFN